MRIFMAALLAAFLAAPVAFAADRPVGPETGQARHAAEDDRDFGQGNDEDWGAPFRNSGPSNEVRRSSTDCIWYCRWGWCQKRCGW